MTRKIVDIRRDLKDGRAILRFYESLGERTDRQAKRVADEQKELQVLIEKQDAAPKRIAEVNRRQLALEREEELFPHRAVIEKLASLKKALAIEAAKRNEEST